MFNNSKEIIKTIADKSLINSWILFLSDIWKDNIEVIKQKLIYNIQDKFIWNNEVENYINEQLEKLNSYNKEGVF
jgi:hypothetical protein